MTPAAGPFHPRAPHREMLPGRAGSPKPPSSATHLVPPVAELPPRKPAVAGARSGSDVTVSSLHVLDQLEAAEEEAGAFIRRGSVTIGRTGGILMVPQGPGGHTGVILPETRSLTRPAVRPTDAAQRAAQTTPTNRTTGRPSGQSHQSPDISQGMHAGVSRKAWTMEPNTTTTEMYQWPASQLLSIAANMVSQTWNERLAHLGITHAAVLALQELAAEEPISQAQLAARLQVRSSTLSKTLQGLENRGLIARVGVRGDQRQVIVRLTHRGTEILLSVKNVEESFEAYDARLLNGIREDLVEILRPRSGM
ncbi:MarR family transcriptional regulator [Arthrobacter frigidicola]|nr:MarR family transcriptional regulator [Arthrobacter frigidicola]